MNLSGTIKLEVPIVRSARTLQMSGMFDVPPAQISNVEITYDFPLLGRVWNVGLIVGPSGSGKSSIAKEVFGYVDHNYQWDTDRSVLDGFPKSMGIQEIIELLCSVGFSSPPSWMRPYHVLSTGEQFRVYMARAMAEASGDKTIVIDEFTSVIDRTVAQIGSSAIARTVRKKGLQFLAATCHYDVVDWMQPDWVFDTSTSTFTWRLLQRRPDIHIKIRRVHHSLWKVFSRHHYLTADLNPAAVCFAAFIDKEERPIAFNAWLTQPHRSIPNLRRSSRVVTLPDFQGVGIGNRLNETCSSLWAALGYRPMITTSHPAVVNHCERSPLWNNHRKSSRNRGGGMMNRDALGDTIAIDRLTAGFEYVGPKMDKATALALYKDVV